MVSPSIVDDLASSSAVLAAALQGDGPIGTNEHLVAIEMLADQAALDGKEDPADALLAGLAMVLRERGEHSAADLAAIKRGWMLAGAGRLDEAWALAKSLGGVRSRSEILQQGWVEGLGSRRWRGAESRIRQALGGRLRALLAFLAASEGLYGRARELGAEAWQDAELDPEGPHLLAIIAETVSRTLIETGELDPEPETGTRLWLWLDRFDVNRRGETGEMRFRSLLARRSLLLGRLGDALSELRAAVTSADRSGLHLPIAVTRLNLAEVLILLNQVASGCSILDELDFVGRLEGREDIGRRRARLEELARIRRGDSGPTVDRLLSVSTMLGPGPVPEIVFGEPVGGTDEERIGGRAGSAIPTATERRPVSFLALYEQRELAVRWQLHRGDHEAAAQELEHLSTVFQGSESALIGLRLAKLRAWVRFSTGRIDGALEALGPVLSDLEERELLLDAHEAARIQDWCHASIRSGGGSTDPAPVAQRNRSHRLLEKIAISLDTEQRRVFLANKWNDQEEHQLMVLDRCLVRLHELGRAPRWRRPDRWLAYLQAVGELSETIRDRGGRGEGTKLRDRIRRWWARLPRGRPGEVRLDLLVLPDRLVQIREAPLSYGIAVEPVTRQRLRDLVADWYLGLGREGGRDLVDPSASEGDMSRCESLLDEVRSAIDRVLGFGRTLGGLPSRTTRLRIRPDDVLRAFPLACASCGGDPLLRRFAMAVDEAPGGWAESSRGQQIGRRVAFWPRRPHRRALVVGVSEGGSWSSPLEHVPEEIREVEAALRRLGVEPIPISERPSRKEILDLLPTVEIAHFACHGRFVPEQPGLSGLIVRPDCGVDGSEEVLSLADLDELDLGQLRHATFAACWVGDGLILPGGEHVSLPGTLLQRGVGSVLASLWPLPDRLAARFMARFYSHLLRFGCGEALRRTQLDCAQGRLDGRGRGAMAGGRSIRAWGGLQLFGRDGRL